MEVDEHTYQVLLGSIHRLSQITVQFRKDSDRNFSFLCIKLIDIKSGLVTRRVNETFTHTLDETSEARR